MQHAPTPPTPHDLVRLRLAAALAHRVPEVALTLWCPDGPSVVVSRLDRHHPDLSACDFRAAVRSSMSTGRPPIDTSWLGSGPDLSVDGIGVRHVGDGVVAVDHGDGRGRWWPTLLDPGVLTVVLGDAAAAALESEVVDPAVLAACEVAAHPDRELGVTVVQLRTPPGPVCHDRRCDALARVLSRTCVVAELLEGAGSGSRT